ncbi:uncharacterized protein C13orf46 homolog isoform X2 [Pelodiscus sinensis]|uniref:uncharacterized protein C13orf46 homolog isoform X2 n=1 Tax=Pelodiscus sinensis TaxID=13735 RepID=UPI003F6D3E3B
MEKDVNPSHKSYVQGVLLTKTAPGIHRVLTETTDLYRSKSVSSLPLKPELTSLIKKTLQEVEAGNSEESTGNEAEGCQVMLNKKGDDEKKEEKDGDFGQEDCGTGLDTAGLLKDLSAFVEIDLKDETEEITEHFLAEEKQLEEEEEPAELEYGKHFNLHAKH